MSSLDLVSRHKAPMGLRAPSRMSPSALMGGTRAPVVSALVNAFEPTRLARSVLEPLAAAARLRDVAPGTPVCSRERASEAAWLLLDGQVSVGRCGQDGRPSQLVRTVQPGQWIDAASCWLDTPSRHDAWVQATHREPALVAEFPARAVRAALTESPELTAAWLTLLAAQVMQLSQTTDDLMHQDAEGRCAHWLLQQARQASSGAMASPLAGPWRVELRERKRTIAAQLGITPETFSRVLRELTRKALIEVHGYNVALLDPAGLQALAAH